MRRSDAVIYKGKRRPGLTSHRQRERVVIMSISAVILFFNVLAVMACPVWTVMQKGVWL